MACSYHYGTARSPTDYKAATCRSRQCGGLRDADALGETGLAVFAGQQDRAAGPHPLGKLPDPRRTEAGAMADQQRNHRRHARALYQKARPLEHMTYRHACSSTDEQTAAWQLTAWKGRMQTVFQTMLGSDKSRG